VEIRPDLPKMGFASRWLPFSSSMLRAIRTKSSFPGDDAIFLVNRALTDPEEDLI
jgi:hypothetical protein